jgi:hypothetical protein
MESKHTEDRPHAHRSNDAGYDAQDLWSIRKIGGGDVPFCSYAVMAFASFLLFAIAAAWPQSGAKSHQQEPVFRSPFTLKLHVDNEHYYEQKFDRVPYFAGGDVYLFAGEAFGVNVAVADDRLSQITYQPDPAKADVVFRFTQEKSADGFMMILMTRNTLKRKLFFDATMTVPGKAEVYKTNVLPVDADLSNFESWAHPIVQLVLSNFRFSESGSQSDQPPTK